MVVFDRNGHPAAPGLASGYPPFKSRPGASGAMASQFLLECLHPLSLSLLSRAIGPQVEAIAGHRGLFVLPHSFVATHAREADSYPIDRLFWTVVMLLPAIVLAAFLAWKTVTGCSDHRPVQDRQAMVDRRHRGLWPARLHHLPADPAPGRPGDLCQLRQPATSRHGEMSPVRGSLGDAGTGPAGLAGHGLTGLLD